MPESTTGRAPESFDPAPGPSQIVPGQGDICAPLGATWSPQRLLGRGAEFHEAAIPDTDLDIGFAERGTLVAYLGQDPAGYADRWDAWWTAWRAVQAIDHTRARKWLVVEHQGRFYPFEARTPDWSPQVDEFGRFPEGQFPPPGPCRFPIEDGQMISWTAIGLFAPLGTLKMEWVRYAWSVPNMLDCARLTHPCLQVSGGIGWWCATEDVYPEIAAGWYNCNVINPTSINVARPVV